MDNLVAGLAAERIDVVRLGRPENTRNDLLRYSFDEQVRLLRCYFRNCRAHARDLDDRLRTRQGWMLMIRRLGSWSEIKFCDERK